jgi:undecaprenyl-diphosphatase
MIDFLDSVDRVVFLFVNRSLANPITDYVMPLVTSDDNLRVLYVLAMILLLIKGDARLRWLVAFSALALLITDQVSAGLLKPIFARLRPCHTINQVHLLVNCGGGYAMPSTHAANAVAQAVLFGTCVRQVRYYLYAFAALIALSRVFVGAHYPLDVVVGAAIGVVIGGIILLGFRRFESRVLARPDSASSGTE